MRKPLVLGIAGALLAVVLTTLGVLHAVAVPVTLTIEGQPTRLRTIEPTVEGLLRSRGVHLKEHDTVSPSPRTRLQAGTEVTVRYARKVNMTIDGSRRDVWTTAADVDELLHQLRMSEHDARVSVSRSTQIGRAGLSLSVERAQGVTIRSRGNETRVQAHGTVADALRQAHVSVEPTDRVTPPLDSQLAADTVITVVTVRDVEVTRTAPVKSRVTIKQDAGKPRGYQKVEQKGADGVLTEIWVEHQEDGVKVSETKKSSQVTKAAVDEVRIVGKGGDISAAAGAPASSGSRNDIMAAAGISPGDYGYVERLIAKESGWNPNARNAGSGACGLVQALPCSKLGPRWNDPVVALKWGDNYVRERYGSWAGAWAHSQSTGWY